MTGKGNVVLRRGRDEGRAGRGKLQGGKVGSGVYCGFVVAVIRCFG